MKLDILKIFILILIITASFLLRLNSLNHKALTHWDESFGAIVAKNLLKHPLKPTLIDKPYIPLDFRQWDKNHVWLAKGILPLWQIAFSYFILGVNTFALRLPSLIFASGAVLLTYLIGKELFSKTTGLIAAALLAFNPVVTELVHGYLFSDHFDVSLLFWIVASMYFILRFAKTKKTNCLIAAGIAQGFAYLSKSYFALIITLVMIGMSLFQRVLKQRAEKYFSFKLRDVVFVFVVFVITILPWTIYSAFQFPQEFVHENLQIFKRLSEGVEIWKGPWDRVIFDYLPYLYSVFFIPLITTFGLAIARSFMKKDIKLGFLLLWASPVIIIMSIFTATKAPAYTLLAMPAIFLIFGAVTTRALNGDRLFLTALAASFVITIFNPPVIPKWGIGYGKDYAFGSIIFKNPWILTHALFVVLVIIVALWISRYIQPNPRGIISRAAILFCVTAFTFLLTKNIRSLWNVTERNKNSPIYTEISAYANSHLSPNAVLLFEEQNYEHLDIMFRTDFTAYALYENMDQIAQQVIKNNGIPYIVTHRELPITALFTSIKEERTIYKWQPTYYVKTTF